MRFPTTEGVTDTLIAKPVAAHVRWSFATRAAFRFCFTYFGLYVLCTQMIGGLLRLPVGGIPPLGTLGWPRAGVEWVAAHVFHVAQPLVIRGGSGDKTFDWLQALCILVAALTVTAVWSLNDRTRGNYVRLHGWFRLFIRFALGSTMVAYGLSKVIPLQMPAPQLTRLLEPFGNFSPMGVLWYSVGASRPYEMFTGWAELTAGVLLFVPRLSTLGALVCLADAIQIFTLNMTYDVPVKLFSFHLILLSLFLLAPDAKRLANVLVLNRIAEPSTETLWTSRRARRIALVVQLAYGAYLVVMSLTGDVVAWSTYGGGAAKSPLHGIWDVDEMAVDGAIRAPLVVDNGRWRRVVFQAPTAIAFQRMDDTFVTYRAGVDVASHAVVLSSPADKAWGARFAYERPTPDLLTLDGTMDGRSVRMRLRRFDEKNFLLVSRGFHWVQEYPFNR